VERSASLGAEMKRRLLEMKEKYDLIGDVRGEGLMIGLELVRDRKTKEPLPRNVCERIFLESLRRGLLHMGYVPRIRINPPLTITAEQIDEGLGVLDEVFALVSADDSWKSA
ncbi:MAG: aminotransferase class III-fold pyridoxal phosphate-dependent enzyme, partial [Candidatus Binatia bacterium]